VEKISVHLGLSSQAANSKGSTNVPDIAMSFSDARFAYGPFAPYWVPRQYIENYFSIHKTDSYLVLNTTVEKLTRIQPSSKGGEDRWRLVLRKYEPATHVDIWWEEEFDAVILANGHYSIPYVRETLSQHLAVPSNGVLG